MYMARLGSLDEDGKVKSSQNPTPFLHPANKMNKSQK